MREAYLVMVNANNNNNKYYHMVQKNDGMFVVTYGRVGKAGQSREYPIWDWDKKYYEKIDKGYKDVTELQSVPVKETFEQSSGSEAVNELLETLHYYSSSYIKKNYRVGAEKVTPKMVDKAQAIIAEMQSAARDNNIMRFNWLCEDLFTVIPRIIPNVREAVAKECSDMNTILEREQARLNVMSSSVEIKKVNGKSLADSMGIEIREVTAEEEQNILNHLSRTTKSHFKRAFKVVNKNTAKKFKAFCEKNEYGEADIKYMFHGSRNQNWEGILSQGLLINPKAIITGKMFGYGIYGAPRSVKAGGYSSLSGSYWSGENSNHGFIAVFKFAMKNPMHTERTNSFFHGCTYRKLKNRGHDSVYAHKGSALRNDEVIVYNESQVDIEYLIEVE